MEVIKKKIIIKAFIIKTFIKYNWIFWRSKFYFLNKKDEDYISLKLNNIKNYQRYYYNLCKYFLIEGYAVVIYADFTSFLDLELNSLSSLIFKEKRVYLSLNNKKTHHRFTDINLNPNYFNFLNQKTYSKKEYYIPIGQHPFAYFEGFWNKFHKFPVKRKRSLFFAGNFNLNFYNRLENSVLFGVNSRKQIRDFLTGSEKFLLFRNLDDIENYVKSKTDNKIVFVEKKGNSGIPQEYLRLYTSHFDFFFALPGTVMPLCHNIIEAMSVGTIPFLEEGYANVMRPPLENGKNCITFRNLDELDNKFKLIFSFDSEKINALRKSVIEYHDSYLSPSAIVSKLINGGYDIIYLNAEYQSVELLGRINEIKKQ